VAPAIATIEYGTLSWFAQAVVGPVTVPGVKGTERMVVLRAGLVPQVFPAVTISVPEVNAALKSTVTLFVPCPDATVALSGAVQLYDEAPPTAAIEYETLADPAHTPLIEPVIAGGVVGVAYSFKVLCPLIPKQFPAETLMYPPLNVEDVFTEILFVPAPDAIDIPAGSIQS
jgi:hypothetical protein